MAHTIATQHFSPELAAKIGLEAAVVFQKIFDCWKNPKMVGTREDGIKWIRNPVKSADPQKIESARSHRKQIDWAGNFPFLSVWQIRRTIAHLEELGLIISRKLKNRRWDACKFYSIVENKLTELLKPLTSSICELPQIDVRETDRSTCGLPANHIHEYDSLKQSQIEREAVAESWKEDAGEGAPKDLGETQCQTQKYFAQPRDSQLGESSATDEFDFDGGRLREFQRQLENLGERIGKKNPVAWAFKIVENLVAGRHTPYWEEFQAGTTLGTCEQHEWEIAPGEICQIAKQCLHDYCLNRKQGTSATEAALQAAKIATDPKQMRAVWESIGRQVMMRREQWEAQKAIGVTEPYLDSWMRPQSPATNIEAIGGALAQLQEPATGGDSQFLPGSEPESETGAEVRRTAIAKIKATLRGRGFGKPKERKFANASTTPIEVPADFVSDAEDTEIW